MRVPDALLAGPKAYPGLRDVIVASGADTERFLQGQLSQDVGGLSVGDSAWSLLLQPQGKVVAWLRVTRTADDAFVLDIDHGAGEAAVARLRRFLLRTACDLRLEVWQIVAIRGQGASEVDVEHSVLALPAAWPGVEGIDLVGPAVSVPPGVPVGAAEELELLRVVAGVPAMGAELNEGTIPAEAGIVDRSVSFTKGCYTGQELVARIDSRGGNVPRRLCGVVADGELQVGQRLTVDGAEVGVVTSVAGDGRRWYALAYLRRGTTIPGPVLAGETDAHVQELPLSL